MQNVERGTILVIEDERMLRKLVCSYLDDENIPYIDKEDALETLDVIATQPVELVLLDIMLPYQDGFETIRQLRAVAASIPIIAMSTCKSYLQIARSLGADDVLLKPFRREEMLKKIARLSVRAVV